MKKVLSLIITFALAACFAYGQKTVTLTISDTQSASYYCYHRMTGGTYSSGDRVNCGTNKTCIYTIAAPVALGTHRFVCTAYVMDGTTQLESPYSNEYSWTNAPQAPTITGSVAWISRKEVTLLAQTSIPMRTTIRYTQTSGAKKTYTKPISSEPAINHTAQLKGLSPHTTYNYTWTATADNYEPITLSGSFTTS